MRGFPVLADPVPITSCFRRRFELTGRPAVATVRVTADSRYVLWVNGTEVARGPVRGDPRRLHHDVVDVIEHLVDGENVLAATVRFYAVANPWWRPAPVTVQLGAGGFLLEADGEGLTPEGGPLVTDASWRTPPESAWEDAGAVGITALAPEVHDAGLLPAGWREPGFDDRAWRPAVELTGHQIGFTGRHSPPLAPYGPLPPRPIGRLGGDLRSSRPTGVGHVDRAEGEDPPHDPVLRAEADGRRAGLGGGPTHWPLEVPGGEGRVDVVMVDLDEEVAGTVVLDLDAPAGATVDVALAEAVDEDGRLARLQQHSGFRYVARGERDRFETFDPVGFRHALLAVRSPGPVVVRGLSVRERLHPLDPVGRFTCSDPLLEQIWQAGRRTVDLCAQDAYLDCPSREQRAWTGDSVVHQSVDLLTNGDWRLARRHPVLAASPRSDGMLPMAAAGDIEHLDPAFIPDWALHWVRSVHNLYRWTGDEALVAGLLGVAEGVLRWFEPFQGPDGLLADVTGWVLIDWSAVSVGGASSALNGLWARALLDFADMARWLGDEARAAWACERHAGVRAGFEAFWDERRGLYVDHIEDGTRQPPVSQHGLASAIVGGLVPDARLAGLVEALTDPDRRVHAAWLVPGRDARSAGPDDMYVGMANLVLGLPEPWWDVDTGVVAAQPFFRTVVHDALAAAGRADLVATACRDWEALLERCPTTLSETWFGGSYCHGWSATPTRDLLLYTLGISPAEPGFEAARVAPRLGHLEWAEGRVPTPFGPISVRAGDEVVVDSPVPVEVDLGAGDVHSAPAGRRRFPVRNRR